ncbi:uncharacterized protein J3R85_011267 [Psidium guajava]|nr:uncharacterized protein J3R85_011267 [Psidium guajava]
MGELEALVELDLSSLEIYFLHGFIGRLMSLAHLSLYLCKNLHELLSSIRKLESLVKLDFENSRIYVVPNSIGRLMGLTHLYFLFCKNLHELLDSIEELELLMELELDFSSISILPHSTRRILKIYFYLNAKIYVSFLTYWENRIINQVDLKLSDISIFLDSIGRLTNLTPLSFSGCMNLRDRLDSVGQMELLVELDLKSSGISLLPNIIGNLKRLKVLNMAYTKTRKIPCPLGVGGVVTLENLDSSFCPHLMDETTWEMWSLTQLRILALDGSPTSTVPRNISGFTSLQMLKIASHRLSLLPDLPSSLKCLVVAAAECLAPRMPDLLRLKSLRSVTAHWFGGVGIPEASALHHGEVIEQLPDLSKLKNLLRLEIKHCVKLRAVEGLKEPKILENAEIRCCMSLERLPDVSAFTKLETHWTPPEPAKHTIQPAKRL